VVGLFAVLLTYAGVCLGVIKHPVTKARLVPDTDNDDWDTEHFGERDGAWNCFGTSSPGAAMKAGSDSKFVGTNPGGEDDNNLWHADCCNTTFTLGSAQAALDADHEAIRLWAKCMNNYSSGQFTLHYFVPPNSNYCGSDSYVMCSGLSGEGTGNWVVCDWTDEDEYWEPFPWTSTSELNSLDVTIWGFHDAEQDTGTFALDWVMLRWYTYEVGGGG